MEWTNATRREALAETCRSLADLADGLSLAEWSTPTGCPGWTVFDQVAHVASLESMLAGVPVFAHSAGSREHVRNSIGAAMEDLLDARRGWQPVRLLAELREVTRLRQIQLTPLDDVADATVPGPTGKAMPIAFGVSLRVFDCLAHEMDVRRALGRPGGLDGAAGRLVADQLPDLLRRTWSRQVAAEVELSIDGTTTSMALGDAGPRVVVACSLADLIALATGRSDADPTRVRVEGDREIGQQLLAAMGLTP